MRFLLGIAVCLAAGCLLGGTCARASNPIITTSYSADPSAHVFEGRMYVYASHDRNDAREFDMIDYHVYSSDDMENWRDHGVVLRLQDIHWARSHLWAPDCGYKNQKYYLYFPAQDANGVFRVGVAVGNSPSGPFVDSGRPIPGVQGIDPSIFTDSDGQAYLVWAASGNRVLMARMKPNMLELDGAPKQLDGADNFFEGPWIFRRAGKYYLTYPAFKPHGVGRGGHGQNYDYAMASNIWGPYLYKGAFTQSGPGGDNIHGSQLRWANHWYCFYHDFSTSRGYAHQDVKRNVRVDEMFFNPDGTIQPLRWTNTGPAKRKNADPYAQMQAETLNMTDLPEGPHAIAVDRDSTGNVYLGPVKNGDWVRYANLDFGSGAGKFIARVATPVGGGTIEVHLDTISAPQIGECQVRYTGGWQNWEMVSCPIAHASGVHDLYLKFIDPHAGGLFDLDWFQFSKN
jgi:arabinoxylan arabinofuranohydrolase